MLRPVRLKWKLNMINIQETVAAKLNFNAYSSLAVTLHNHLFKTGDGDPNNRQSTDTRNVTHPS